MPKLPAFSLGYTTPDGISATWQADVTVTQTGEFHCTFPEEWLAVANAELAARKHPPVLPPLTLHRARTHWQVHGSTLRDCETFLKRVAHQYSQPEIDVERILLYHCDPDLAYFRTADGQIRPNAGGVSEAERAAGLWRGAKMDHRPSDLHYRLGLYARVADRVTERRGASVAVSYRLIYRTTPGAPASMAGRKWRFPTMRLRSLPGRPCPTQNAPPSFSITCFSGSVKSPNS